MGKTPERAPQGVFSSEPLEPVSLDYASILRNLPSYAAFAGVGMYMLQGESSVFTGGFVDGIFGIAEQQYEELGLERRRAPEGFNFNEREKKEQSVFLGNSRLEPVFPSTQCTNIFYNSSEQFSKAARGVRGNRSGFLPRRTP